MTTSWLIEPSSIQTREVAPKHRQLVSHIWTQRKAHLIRLYLGLFVFVTKRGTYIDAFAGPQKLKDAWAARLLWEHNPGRKRRRLDRFELFEKKPASVRALNEMTAKISRDGRALNIYPGDCNTLVPQMLLSSPITDPAFCLLDQRSIECNWALLEALARHKSSGHKIELFYFLMAGWKNRSLKNLTKNPKNDLIRWWGRADYDLAIKADNNRLAELFGERFQKDLGYQFVDPYPIYAAPEDGGRLQYWMIHASDHEEAQKFMRRAYQKLACGYDPSNKQDVFDWTTDELNAALSSVEGWDAETGV